MLLIAGACLQRPGRLPQQSGSRPGRPPLLAMRFLLRSVVGGPPAQLPDPFADGANPAHTVRAAPLGREVNLLGPPLASAAGVPADHCHSDAKPVLHPSG